jgi:hypothetical protein
MSTSSKKTGCVRRALMAGVFVAAGALSIGAATAPAHAQYYSYQYNNPYYSNSPYQNGYQAHYAWWRWHQYWRWYHQNYR